MQVLMLLAFVVLLLIAGFVAKIAGWKYASIAFFVVAGIVVLSDMFFGFFTGMPKH